MVLDYRIPDELKKSYKEKLSKEKEKLNPESQKFIEDVLKGNVKTGMYEHETFAILEMKKKIKNIVIKILGEQPIILNCFKI